MLVGLAASLAYVRALNLRRRRYRRLRPTIPFVSVSFLSLVPTRLTYLNLQFGPLEYVR